MPSISTRNRKRKYNENCGKRARVSLYLNREYFFLSYSIACRIQYVYVRRTFSATRFQRARRDVLSSFDGKGERAMFYFLWEINLRDVPNIYRNAYKMRVDLYLGEGGAIHITSDFCTIYLTSRRRSSACILAQRSAAAFPHHLQACMLETPYFRRVSAIFRISTKYVSPERFAILVRFVASKAPVSFAEFSLPPTGP